MAGRKSDPKAAFRMQVHETNHYLYAATVSTEYRNGKRIRRYTHWGTLSRDLVFTPNVKYVMAAQELKESFIFPQEWDVSLATTIALENAEKQREKAAESEAAFGKLSKRKTARVKDEKEQRANDDSASLLYGSVWFLLQLAEKNQVIHDLMETFDRDEKMVRDVLTLATYSLLTGKSYDRLLRDQRITRYPSVGSLTPLCVSEVMQEITERDRVSFCEKRILRHAGETFFACKSNTDSDWGRQRAEMNYGLHRNNVDLEVLRECVAYCASSREPVYYRTFPGNEMDACVERTVHDEMVRLGAREPLELKDGEIKKAARLDAFLRDGRDFVSMVSTREKPIARVISCVKYDADGLPENMRYDAERKLFYASFPMGKKEPLDGGGKRKLSCELFLDPARRPLDLIEVNRRIAAERAELREKERLGTLAREHETINDEVLYHKVSFSYQPETKKVTCAVSEDKKAIRTAREACGFLAYVTYGTMPDAQDLTGQSGESGTGFAGDGGSPIMEACGAREDQRRFYERMKEQLDYHVPGEDVGYGKTGREFIVFVSMILDYLVRKTWESSAALRSHYLTPAGVLDEMADIRVHTGEDGNEYLSRFLPQQEEICEIYGISRD